jgi:ribosomal subunit interface protein
MKIEYLLTNIYLKEKNKQDVEEKLNKLERFSNEIQKARVDLSYRPSRPKEQGVRLEVNLKMPHKLLRAIEHSSSVQDAINKVEKKLKRQIRKYKTFGEAKKRIVRKTIRRIKRKK